MAIINANFDNAFTWVEGTYTFQIANVETGSGKKGAYLVLTLNILNGPIPKAIGKSLTEFVSFADNMLYKAKQFLVSIGYPEEMLKGDVPLDTNDMIARQFVADCYVEPGEGNFPPRLRIGEYHRGVTAAQAPEGEGTVQAPAAPAPAPAPAPAAAAPAPAGVPQPVPTGAVPAGGPQPMAPQPVQPGTVNPNAQV